MNRWTVAPYLMERLRAILEKNGGHQKVAKLDQLAREKFERAINKKFRR